MDNQDSSVVSDVSVTVASSSSSSSSVVERSLPLVDPAITTEEEDGATLTLTSTITLEEEDEEDEDVVEIYDEPIGASSVTTTNEMTSSSTNAQPATDPYVNVDLESLLLGANKLDFSKHTGKPKSGTPSEIGDDDQSQVEDEEWTLDTLPIEVFLKICSFLEAGSLIHTLSLVCKRFHQILSNETTWRIRQTQRWYRNGVYPPIQVNEDEFRWSLACLKREEQIKLWGNSGSNLRNVELHSHIGCVDAVHLFNNGEFLASGSRDRSINIYNVQKCFDVAGEIDVAVPGLIHHKVAAHKGWIWSFATSPSYLFSGSWDNTLKCWDRKSNFDVVTEYKTKSPCLCLSAMENLMVAGTFDKKVLLFDPRVNTNTEPVSRYLVHKKAVLAIGMDENNIISCGEDGRLVKYDLKAGKVQRIVALRSPAYATCLSFRREDPASLFYIGDKLGNLYLVDSKAFKIVKKYTGVHTRTIQGVYHGLGSVFTCSSDGQMKTFEPSSGLKELSSIHIPAELPDVHSLNNIVALASGEGIVRLYAPVSDFYN